MNSAPLTIVARREELAKFRCELCGFETDFRTVPANGSLRHMCPNAPKRTQPKRGLGDWVAIFARKIWRKKCRGCEERREKLNRFGTWLRSRR